MTQDTTTQEATVASTLTFDHEADRFAVQRMSDGTTRARVSQPARDGMTVWEWPLIPSDQVDAVEAAFVLQATERVPQERTGLSASIVNALRAASTMRHAAEEQRDNYRTNYLQMSRAMDEFQDTVRNAVIAAKDEHNLCDAGVNRFLEELGLDPLEREFTVSWTERYIVTVDRSATVTARDEDDAIEKVSDDPDQYGEVDTDDLLRQVRYGNYELDDEHEPDDYSAEEA